MVVNTCSQTFVSNAHVGVDVDVSHIRAENDALVICTGATWPRDLRIPGRNADGVHFAMEYLQVGSYVSFVFKSYRSFFKISSTHNRFLTLS
jgi:hypothetical protein